VIEIRELEIAFLNFNPMENIITITTEGVRSETPPKNVIGYKISNSLWTGLGILSPVTFLEAWLGVSERTQAMLPM